MFIHYLRYSIIIICDQIVTKLEKNYKILWQFFRNAYENAKTCRYNKQKKELLQRLYAEMEEIKNERKRD